MLFAYLDEFGHCGPFVHRQDAVYKDSPVFGLAGFVLPETSIRPFATRFLKLKENAFAADIQRAGKHAYDWEKKGSDIFRPKAMERYPALRQVGFRLLNTVKALDGKVFYYGREKIVGRTDVNANGLYTTVFAKAIRSLDAYANSVNCNFAIVVDQHSARKELLECAAKTMYGQQPTKRLVSPPFEVESHFNQSIQAADWIASLVGRRGAFQVLPDQYRDHEQFEKYFGRRLDHLATHSSIVRRKAKPAVVGLTSIPDSATEIPPQLQPDGAKRETVRYSIRDI